MLTLHNTLTKQKETFKPIVPGKVGMYTCGLTVNNYAHIGHFKSYVTSDTLYRLLKHHGYEVRMIKNITDVGHLTRDDVSQGDSGEDKIQLKALSEHKSPEAIAKFYEAYLNDAEQKMNILSPAYTPHATAHIPHMIKCIKALIKNGHAYEKNGNVFYDVTTFPHYGKLSGNTLEHLRTGARLERHPDKKNEWDFALWLKAPENHLMQWDSPWSRGYPGWHIECSAMSMEYLGDQFDIHTGGEDHIFPHHEAEIAQTEGVTGKHPSVRIWIHTRHMMIDGKKMSKSKGNCYRLEDIAEKGYSPMHLRIALLSGHYRSQMNFTWDALAQAKKNFEKITNWVQEISPSLSSPPARGGDVRQRTEGVGALEQKFWSAINDDLNTPLALSVLYEIITFTNAHTNEIASDVVLALWNRINAVLGLTLPAGAPSDLPPEIRILIDDRDIARTEKNFVLSDELRQKIEALGYVVEDAKEGTRVKQVT